MDTVTQFIREHPERLAQSYERLEPLGHLEIEVRLDWRCNAKCKFCGVWKYSRDGMLSLDRWREVFDDLADAGLAYALFTGGEPMLYPHFHEIVEHLDARGVSLGIITNGSLLNEERVRRLATLRGLRDITVSLDSPVAEVHDEVRKMRGLFDRAVRGMALVRELLPETRLTVNTVVSADTVDTVQGLLDLPTKPDRIRVFPVGLDLPWLDSLATVTENDWAPWAAEAKTQQIAPDALSRGRDALLAMVEPARELGVALEFERMEDDSAQEPYQGTCLVPLGHVVIQPDGNVFPCCHVQDAANRIGRLGEQTSAEMFAGEEYKRFVGSVRPATLPACRSCSRYRGFNREANELLRIQAPGQALR
jgi:radical SAM protein with 4Fe4S-binding SPASM domain